MIESLLALLSIACGIIGANFTGYLYKRFSLGITGNSIAGVFGSILLIKSLGRLGFDPVSIMETGSVNLLLLSINITVSIISGALAIVLVSKLKEKLLKKGKL